MKRIFIPSGKKKRRYPILGKFSPEVKLGRYYWNKPWGGRLTFSFGPEEYNGDSKKAFQHAKQYEGFYKALIKEGVYPEGTKVKAKKIKHSNKYTLEFWMPEVREIRDPKYLQKKDLEFASKEIDKLRETMERVAKNHGSPYGSLTEDPGRFNNYGFDSKGRIRYLDTEVLWSQIPFKLKGNKLEKTASRIVALIGFAFSFYFLSPNLTGNIVGNLGTQTANSVGIILFLGALLLGYFRLRT